jgi:NADH:ubiquinone oxidoreductase subunit 3 (subunit A)
LSAEIVALLILVGAIVAAVVFTLVIVVAIDPSDANRRAENEGEKQEEQGSETS